MQAGGFWWEGRLVKPPKHLRILQGSAALCLTSSVAEEALLCSHPDPMILLKFEHRHSVQYSALYFTKIFLSFLVSISLVTLRIEARVQKIVVLFLYRTPCVHCTSQFPVTEELVLSHHTGAHT